jgi:hypothetical protein
LSDAYLIHNLKIVYGKDGLTWDELKQVPASVSLSDVGLHGFFNFNKSSFYESV